MQKENGVKQMDGTFEIISASSQPRSLAEDWKLQRRFFSLVYVVQLVQILITICMAYSVKTTKSLADLILKSNWHMILLLPLVVLDIYFLKRLSRCRKSYPLNWVFMVLFTVLAAFLVALPDSTFKTPILLMAVCLKFVSMTGLFVYTMWVTCRGLPFKFWRPFITISLIIVILFPVAQLILPHKKNGDTLYLVLFAIIGLAAAMKTIPKLLASYECEDYIWAATGQYVDLGYAAMTVLVEYFT